MALLLSYFIVMEMWTSNVPNAFETLCVAASQILWVLGESGDYRIFIV